MRLAVVAAATAAVVAVVALEESSMAYIM
jgi:hypothetical protein